MDSYKDDSFYDDLFKMMTVETVPNNTIANISFDKNIPVNDSLNDKEIEDDYEIVGNEILPTYNFIPQGVDSNDDPYIHQVNENSKKSTIVIHIEAHGKFLKGKENTLPKHLTTNTFMFAYAPPDTVNMVNLNSTRNYAESIEHALAEKYPIMPVFDTVREKFTNNDSEIYKYNSNILNNYNKNKKRAIPSYDKTTDVNYKYYKDHNHEVKFKRNANMFIPKTDMEFSSGIISENRFLINGKTDQMWIGCSINVTDVRYPKSPLQQEVFDRRLGHADYRDEHYVPNRSAPIFNDIFKYKDHVKSNDIKYTTLSAILNVLRNDLDFDFIFIEINSCRVKEFDTDYFFKNSEDWNIQTPFTFPTDAYVELHKVRHFIEQKEEIDNLPNIDFIRTLGGTRRRRIRHRRRRPTYTRHNTKMHHPKRSYKRKHTKPKTKKA